jgi:hypothetical protein
VNATTSGGGVISGSCTRTLEVDERNIIIITFRGSSSGGSAKETIARLSRVSNTHDAS